MAPGVEFADLNWMAIAAAVVANIVLGFLWYSPKMPTGKLWMKHAGIPADHKPAGAQIAKGMVLMFVGAFLMMFIFGHNFIAYEDAYRLDEAGYNLTIVDGLMGAAFTWLGFFVPVLWAGVAWENKSWALFFVNALYYLVVLLIAGILLVSL